MKDLFAKHFEYYKMLGDRSLEQLSFEQLIRQHNEESNSIAVIVKHVAGNMLSRWTSFLTEDGEKAWRNRDAEFTDTFRDKQEILAYWEKGWSCLFEALHQINDENINATVYIRREAHTVADAVLRQLAHYPYHIGQIVYLARMMKQGEWQTLSIAKGSSAEFNAGMGMELLESAASGSSSVHNLDIPKIKDAYKP